MKILMLLSHAPIPRFIKRLKIASISGETKLLYWDRKLKNDIKFSLPQGIEAEKISLKAPQGKTFKRSILLLLFSVRAYIKIIKYKPDIVHVGNIDMLFIAYFYKVFLNRELKIIYEIGDLPEIVFREGFLGKCFRQVERVFLKKIDILILTSPYFWEKYYNKLTTKNKYHFIPNVPSRMITKNTNTEVKPLDNNKKKLTIGYIGAVRYEKQLKMLIDCVKNHSDIKLLIAGAGKNLETLKKYSEEANNINFFGSYDYKDIGKLYSKVDIIFSVYDTNKKNVRIALPNRLYEAIMFEKPIIASKNTALANFIYEYSIGYTVSDSILDDLKELIKTIVENQKDLEEKKENMKQIKEEYVYEHYTPIVKKFYRK